jgi:5-formyltetrahydrofolate cyclo-ligase
MSQEARKRALRRQMAARWRALPAETARSASEAAASNLSDTEEFRSAVQVLLFAALPDEIATRPLFEAAIRAGKRCLLPRCCEARRLEFAPLDRWEDLRPGRYSVLEPPAGAPAFALGAGDLAVVPGVAFDAGGHRLGRGAGYYDRAFPPAGRLGEAAPALFGLAASFQLVKEVPHTEHDGIVDAVATELGIVRTGSKGSR